ncbi:hypothetical protein [Chryseobacterium bernardetii]|uniref:hypothetical protein n=1 Tax=Chryseobacterium bernardetii TaxID=1241978 RepID=UPI003AF488D9
MITKEKARKIIENEEEVFSDEDLEIVIKLLNEYASIVFEAYSAIEIEKEESEQIKNEKKVENEKN